MGGPLLRKINRMYVMLSGPIAMQQRSSHRLNHDRNGNNIHLPSSSVQSFPSAETESNSKVQSEAESDDWFSRVLTPYINDWIPSIGFSAIILSTMYLIVKYHK